MPRRNKREEFVSSDLSVKPSKLRYERKLKGAQKRKKRLKYRHKGGELG